MYTVTDLEKQCVACPSSWFAETKEGVKIYIRYRWGKLSIKEYENKNQLYKEQIGDDYDGDISVSEMKKAVPSDILTFEV